MEFTNDLICRLILAGVATYRVGRMIAVDNGPFSIFHKMREWFGRKASQGGKDRMKLDKTVLGGFWYESWLMVTCPCCIPSLLPAILFFFAVINPSRFGDAMLMIFAIFGVSVFMNFGFGVDDEL